MGVGKLDLETIAATLTGWGQVRLQGDACIRGKSPRATCQRCQEACPVKGIDLGSGGPVVKDCQRCGLCTAACPTGALEDPERTHSFFLARGRESIAVTGQALFTCSQGGEDHRRDGWIMTSCLGAVTPEVVLALAVRGQVGFRYLPEKCAGCPWGEKGEQLFLSSFAWARQALEAMGLPGNRLFRGEYRKPAPNKSGAAGRTGGSQITAAMGRREFFRSLVRGIKIPGVKITPAAPSLQSGPARSRALILQQALEEARPAGGYPAKARLPLASLKIAAPCYLCNICSRLCPAGALELAQGELRFYPSRCNHCDLCLAVCPHHSLVWGEDLPLEFITVGATCTLAVATEHQCASCGETFQASAAAVECLRCTLNRHLPGGPAGRAGA
ncbi:4Fe-4S binding protein [Neomoorella carbonis]|uniref:4Fe-4S binding protein n=1 Tax=Neomoorella carbonis TaxID=3062783 RepID=UPI003249E0C6